MRNVYKVLPIINTSLLLLLFTVGVGIYLCIMPKTGDDYWYGVFLRPWFEKSGYISPDCGWDALRGGIPFEDIKYSWYCHYGVDNARLGNQIVMFFLMIPKWAGSAVALLFWILCMRYSLKFARIEISRFLIVAAGVFLWTFQMPWNDNMGQLDYQFNYLIAGGSTIWYLWSACNSVWKGCKKVLMIITGILIGAWHEGFSAPVIAGVIAVTALYPRYRTLQLLYVIISLTIGCVYLMMCPGTAVRMEIHYNVVTHSLLLILQCIFCHVAYLVILIWAIIKICKTCSVKLSPLIWFAIVSGGVSVLGQIFSHGARRVGWWADEISIVTIMYLLGKMSDDIGGLKRVGMNVSALGLAILSIIHWVYVDYYAFVVRTKIREVEKAMVDSESKTIFCDFPTIYDLPMICMWTPDMRMFADRPFDAFMNEYYFYEDKYLYKTLVPAALRNVTGSSGNAVPGGSGIREKDGHLFVDAALICDGNKLHGYLLRGDIRMSTGIGGEELFLTRPFVSEADGREYLYVYPSEQIWKVLFGKIESITDLKDRK